MYMEYSHYSNLKKSIYGRSRSLKYALNPINNNDIFHFTENLYHVLAGYPNFNQNCILNKKGIFYLKNHYIIMKRTEYVCNMAGMWPTQINGLITIFFI